MQGVRHWRSLIAASVVAAATTTATAIPATAFEQPGTGTTGGTKGHDLTAGVSSISFEPAAVPAGGKLTSTTSWTPPACWLEPQYTSEQLKAEREAVWESESTGYEWEQKERDYYVNGHPHTNFEIENADKGMWWDGVPNPNRIGDPESLECFQEFSEWVLDGDDPETGNAVTPEILAQAAYERIRVPDTDVSLSPDTKQTVNLDTWAWLDKSTFKSVSVTARLNALGIWATTTATPVALHLDPGTDDADVYPSSGDCKIGKDGNIGVKYTSDDKGKTPSCGFTYRRPSGGGTFPLKATITWKVVWEGSGGTGGSLPDGTFGTTTNLTVQEVQTVNR